MKTVAQVILIRRDGAVILRQRDDNELTPDAGLVTPFDAIATPEETPRDAAFRALAQYTNTELSPQELVFWRHYPLPKAHPGPDQDTFFFVADHVTSSRLHLLDGSQPVVIHNRHEASKINTSELFRRVLADYFHEVRRHRHLKGVIATGRSKPQPL